MGKPPVFPKRFKFWPTVKVNLNVHQGEHNQMGGTADEPGRFKEAHFMPHTFLSTSYAACLFLTQYEIKWLS